MGRWSIHRLPYVAPGKVSAINTFGNLAVWWGGFACLFCLSWGWFAPRAVLRTPQPVPSKPMGPGYILLGFAAQFVPWMLVARLTFIYHYFASLVFAILALVFTLQWLRDRYPLAGKAALWGVVGTSLCLFLLHYPLASGLAVDCGYAYAVNFFKKLHLPGWDYTGWLRY